MEVIPQWRFPLLRCVKAYVTVLTMVSHDSRGVSSLPLISDPTFPFGNALFLDNYLRLLLSTCLALSFFLIPGCKNLKIPAVVNQTLVTTDNNTLSKGEVVGSENGEVGWEKMTTKQGHDTGIKHVGCHRRVWARHCSIWSKGE